MEAFTVPDSFPNTCPGQVSGIPAFLFTQLLQNLIAAHCAINSPSQYPKDYGDKFNESDQFDFIIVGAGSAGSVIANRLTENENWKVLLLEAGGDPSFASDVPAFMFSTQLTDIDWQYESETNDFSCLGTENKKCTYPRGRVFGGSSSINAMLYVRGNRDDYDEWERLGNPGWGYEDVLPYFRKSEKLTGINVLEDGEFDSSVKSWGKEKWFASDRYHSTDGYQYVSPYGEDLVADWLRPALFEAFEEVGIPVTPDINGKSQIGITKAAGTLKHGSRANTAKSFLGPIADRKNLFVIKNAVARKLLTEGNKVIGVEFIRNDKVSVAKATKEVILAAGAINSPQLLMLSGIGPKERLEPLDIPVVADLPGVGENLQDHVYLMGYSMAFPPASEPSPVKVLNDFYRYLMTKSGSFASLGITDTIAFVDTVSGSEIPDIQYHFILFPYKYPAIVTEFSRVGHWRKDIAKQFIDSAEKTNVLGIMPTLLRPKSIGRVELASADPSDPPKIIANLLAEDEDVETLLRGIRRIEGVRNSCSFAEKLGTEFKLNVTDCDFEYGTDEYWRCLIRRLGFSLYHPVGTCKMGVKSDFMAVVDHRLRVHGMEGLRIGDCSIMPVIVRGNTNAPAIMIGEKLADLVKEDWMTTSEH